MTPSCFPGSAIGAATGNSPPRSAPPLAPCSPSASAAGVPEAALEARRVEVRPGDVASVQYTSGTTGFSKGAMLTHRNLLLNAYHVGRRQEFSEHDRLCICVPFYHCFGCVMGTLA